MPKPRTKVVLRLLPLGLTEEVLQQALEAKWERYTTHVRFLYLVPAAVT